jgi:hypothetical protein
MQSQSHPPALVDGAPAGHRVTKLGAPVLSCDGSVAPVCSILAILRGLRLPSCGCAGDACSEGVSRHEVCSNSIGREEAGSRRVIEGGGDTGATQIETIRSVVPGTSKFRRSSAHAGDPFEILGAGAKRQWLMGRFMCAVTGLEGV